MRHDGKSYDSLVEADFSALHYNLLYARLLKQHAGDPYNMVLDELRIPHIPWRDELKQAIVTVANTVSSVSCRVSLTRQLAEIGKIIPHTITANSNGSR